MQWFDVDKAGLRQLLGRRGKAAVVLELLQNAWDQNVTAVTVTLEKAKGSRSVEIRVQDDDPEGFRDLAHAFTLFAPSEKKGQPEKRGRFNLGEKLVLALCDRAEIRTTKGTLTFDRTGRRQSRARTHRGTIFTALMAMTAAELEETIATLRTAINPAGVVTRINGEALVRPTPIARLEARLPTEISDAEGYLRPTVRKTWIEVFAPPEGEKATLFELGVPVVATGDKWHVNIGQKVPLSLERDNVKPSYLRRLRTALVNELAEHMGGEDWVSGWAREALEDERITDQAAAAVIKGRFGEKALAYDASDPEANKRAVAQGYQVVHGAQLSKAEWAAARRAGLLKPAGQVTPSPKVFSEDPQAKPLKTIDRSDWSECETRRIEQIESMSRRLIGEEVHVRLASDPHWPFSACYGHAVMTLNRGRLGKKWFEGPLNEGMLALVLHELAHHYEGDHLSSKYHDAICAMGARLALAVREAPELLGDEVSQKTVAVASVV